MPTLKEYAAQIGAELKPTNLASNEIFEIIEDRTGGFFGPYGECITWLEIKVNDGGINRTGLWPAGVYKCTDSGKLTLDVSRS
jgi:hypothetical protein